MTPNQEWLTTHELTSGRVLLRNHHICKVASVSIIKIKIHDGVIHILTSVMQIANLMKKLTSLGILEDIGCKSQSECGLLRFLKGSHINEDDKSQYYVLSTRFHHYKLKYTVTSTSNSNNMKLWHKRLGQVREW